MLFKESDKPEGYFEFEASGLPLLLFKKESYWDICLKNEMHEDNYPKVIGHIRTGQEGDLENSTKLGWTMSEEYRGQGIMKSALNKFCEEMTPNCDGFEAKILKDNQASLALAKSTKFEIYKETKEFFFLVRK